MRGFRFDFAVRGRPGAAPPAEALEVAGPAAEAADLVLLPQEPPMAAVDESILLLHTAAEVEHSLLAQYLYAAYSLSAEDEPQRSWREALLGIAREEMAHLLSVQNILYLLGGPLNFEREDYPYRAFYPFPFELSPFGLKSAARYVLAEMPKETEIPDELGFKIAEVKEDAGLADLPNHEINRVGALYERLTSLVGGLSETDFHADSLPWQAGPQEWAAAALNLIIRTADNRAASVALLQDIGRQGEGPDEPTGGAHPSHFRRFYALYQEVRALGAAPAALNVPTNPTTRDREAPGYISDEHSRLWAHLFNLRYRILLTHFSHYLRLRGDTQPEKGFRARLRVWCVEEMRNYLASIAAHLTELPQHDPPQTADGRLLVAAAPFELPYALGLPARPVDIWRQHRMLAEESRELCERIAAAQAGQPILAELRAWDEQRLVFINQRVAEG